MAIDKSLLRTLAVPSVMIGITVAAGAVATIPISTADTNDDIVVTVDSACTMGQTVTSAHTTQLNPGETNSTIGESRIAAYCNDTEGYAIYAIGYTNGEYGNTNLVSTNGNNTIATGISGTGSYWNMKLTAGTGSGTTLYTPTIVSPFTTNTAIPDDYTKVAYRDSATPGQTVDPTTSGSYFTTTYQAHVSTTQPAGVYNGQVQYVMVHPSGAEAPEKPLFMQDTAAIKSKLVNVGDTTQATDKRDGKKYWITKLADGNIWMTQNLDLDIDSTKTYTPADTNISSNWTPERSTITTGNLSSTTWPSNTQAQYGPYSYDPGDVFYYSSGTDSDDTKYTSLEACQAEHPDCSMKNHAGNYYSWSAAVASNDTSGLTTQYSNAPGSICPAGWRLPIPRDRSNTAASREWNALLVAEGIMTDPTGDGYATNGFNNIRKSPLWLARSGGVSNGSLSSTAKFGYYWSSTVVGSDSAYSFYFSRSYVIPTSFSNRYYGYSIRCLAQ